MDITGTTYTITDLMSRYNMTRQGVQQFLIRHLAELNTGGLEHAAKIKGDWIIDSTALERLDAMRGYNDSVVLASEVKQLTKIEELQKEVIRLKEENIKIREYNHQQSNSLRDKIIELTGQAHSAQLLLSTAQSGKEQAEAAKAGLQERLDQTAKELDKITAENKTLIEKNGKLAGILSTMGTKEREIIELKEALKKEREKSWWEKLLGK